MLSSCFRTSRAFGSAGTPFGLQFSTWNLSSTFCFNVVRLRQKQFFLDAISRDGESDELLDRVRAHLEVTVEVLQYV